MGANIKYMTELAKKPTVFLSRVKGTNAVPYHPECCYCIVEGSTDELFYSNYLRNFYKKIKVISVEKVTGKMNCNQVKEHLDYYNTNHIGSKYQFLFFIDRDFGAYIQKLNPNIPLNYGNSSFDDITNPENLYLTDDYSIENSIFTKETIKKIFECDFKKIVNDGGKTVKFGNKTEKNKIINMISKLFEMQLEKYELKLATIISILIWCKQKNINYQLSNVNFTEFFDINDTGHIIFKYKTDEGLVVSEGDSNYNENIFQNKLKQKLYDKSLINESTVNYNAVNIIENNLQLKNIFHIFRGHFIEPFWHKFNNNFKKITIAKSKQLTIVNVLEMNTVYANCGYIESLSNFAKRTILKFEQEIQSQP